MDAFEALVVMLLEHEGYWVKSRFKVELTKEEKRLIDRPSSPRWELDVIAYKGISNELLVVECKSYLDSSGVRARDLNNANERYAERYKLFNDPKLRETVLRRLELQLVNSGACALSPSIRLCLAAGKIATDNDRAKLREHFQTNGWMLFDDEWLHERLMDVSRSGYENEVAAIVAKLLLRNGASSSDSLRR